MTLPLTPFVFGHARSGTSLLTAILDRHTSIAMAPETHILHALGRQPAVPDHERLLVIAWDVLRTRMGDLHFPPEVILARFRHHEPTPIGLLRAILELWAARAGKPVAGEKTPAHLPFADRILDGIPHSRAILLIRDGRAVVEAMKRASTPAETPIDDLVDRWIRGAAFCDRWLAQFPDRTRLVRFEDLVQQPHQVLRDLLGWLELEFQPEILEPRPTTTYRRWEAYFKGTVSAPIDPTKADQWRSATGLLTQEHVTRLEPWLARFGYQAESPRPSGSRPVVNPVRVESERPPATSSPATRPPILVVGAHRAGCASLTAWLGEHPELAREGHPPRRTRACLALDWPLARDEFRARTAPGREIPDRQPICHVASYYLAHPDLPRRVRLVAPDARIVVMLRHPVLRSYSQWLYQWRLGTEHLSFGDALLAESSRLGSAEAELAADQHLVRFNHIHYSYALQSRYSALLSRWYQVFPPDQILVLVLEDLLGEEGAAAWARLCRHAGLEPAPVPAFQKWESIEWPLSPPAVLHSAEATLLRATLEDDVRSLRKLLNRGQLWPD